MKKYRVTECKSLVKKILSKCPHTRDSDEKLIAELWLHECKIKNLDFNKVLEHLFYKRLTSPTSIIRVRRLLQNKYIELRGLKYKERTNKLEKDIRDDVRDWNNK